MAKGRKGGYEDALSSIFDFIFTSAKKKEKKPAYRPSGVPGGSDEMARALAEMASQPANYMAEAISQPLGVAANTSWLAIELEPGGEKIEVKPGNIIKVLRDPGSIVDAAFDAQKEANKMNKYYKGASYIDQAIALGIGLKAGMTVQDAMTFGATARGTYKDDTTVSTDYDIRTRHNKLTAENAVLEANIELAKSTALAEGLNPATDAYADRVFELAKANKTQLKKDAEILHKAMNSTGNTRRLGFEGKFHDHSEAALVNARNAELTAAYADVRNSLISQGVDPAKVSKMMQGLEKEIAESDRYAERITAYRMQYQKKQSALAQLSDDPDEVARLIQSGNLALVTERMYGGDGDPRSLYDEGGPQKKISEQFSKEIADTTAAIAASTDPVYQAALQSHLDELNKNLQSIQQKGLEYNRSINNSKEFWRVPITPTASPAADVEYKNFVTARFLDAEKSRLNMQLMTTTDEFEKRQLRANMYRIEKARDVLDQRIPLFAKSKFGEYYSMSQGILTTLRNPGDLIRGKAWTKGYYSGLPGNMGVSQIQIRKEGGYDTMKRKIVLPKDAYGQQSARLRALYPHYSRLASLYYFTPNSIVNTLLVNGEGYSYIAEMRQRALQRSFYADRGNHFDSFIRANPTLFGSIGGLLDSSGNVDHNVLASNYLQVIDTLKVNETLLPATLKDILRGAESRYGSIQRFAKMGNWMNQNVFGNIQKYTDWKTYAKLPGINKVLGGGMKVFEKLPIFGRLAPVIKGEIALKNFIRGGVHSAAATLGLATGGVATIVIEAIAWLGTEVAYRLARPLSKLLLFALVGICSLCGMLVFSFQIPGGLAGSSGLTADVGYTQMEPGTQYYCGEIYTGPPGDPYGNRYPEQPLPPGVNVPIDTGNLPRNATCPVALSPYCYQGPNGGFSHARMGTGAIDLGTAAGVWIAPTDGVVTQAIDDMECEWDRGKSRGGQMRFVDSAGNTYRILHAIPLVGVGEVKAGTAIARMNTGLPVSKCWTGPHYHLDVISGGSWVNAENWYNQLGCGINCP